MGVDWERIYNKIHQHYPYFDENLVKVALATVLTAKGDDKVPLWVTVVDVPSGGKTTLFRWMEPLLKNEEKLTYEIDDWTTAYQQDWIEDAHGKTVTITDLSILTTKIDAEEIFSKLRVLYDGTYKRQAGRGRSADVVSRFNLLMGSTPAWDKYEHIHNQLGPRFLVYRVPQLSLEQELEILDVITNRPPLHKDDKEISRLIQEEIDKLPSKIPLGSIEFPDKEKDALRRVCIAAELLRQGMEKSQVWPYGEIPLYLPQPSRSFRLFTQCMKLARILAWMDGVSQVTEEHIRLVSKCAIDTIPDLRWRLVNLIYDIQEVAPEEYTEERALILINRGQTGVSQDLASFAARLHISPDVLKYYLKDLEWMRIITKMNGFWEGEEALERGFMGQRVMYVKYSLTDEVIDAISLLRKEVPKATESIIYHPIPTIEDYWRETTPVEPQDGMDVKVEMCEYCGAIVPNLVKHYTKCRMLTKEE